MSEKTTLEKLQVKNGRTFKVINQPPEVAALLSQLPEGSRVTGRNEPADILLLFVRSMLELSQHMAVISKEINPNGIQWLAYPKKTSGIKTDLSRDIIWDYLLTIGWTGISMISIDDTWSGFRMKKV